MLLLILAAGLGCGASPRPIEFNPGLPAYPPPFFTPTMPPPTLIGATTERLNRARMDLQERQSDLTRERLFVEYLPRHPYVLEAEYVIDSVESRVTEMRLILDPRLRTQLGLRIALYGELLAAYGAPVPDNDTAARVWEFETYRLIWIEDRLDIRRRDMDGTGGRTRNGSRLPVQPTQENEPTREGTSGA